MFICFKKDGVTCGTKSFFSHMIVYDHDIIITFELALTFLF